MNLLEKEQLISDVNKRFEDQTPQEILEWAVQKFPKLTLACSFGAEDVVLVDMLYKINPNVDIFYLDTDFHFQETYETRDRIADRYENIQFVQVKPKLTPKQQAEKYGDQLWKTNPNQCCSIRKVDPLFSILKKYDAWITGIRREQAPTRASAKKAEYDVKFGLVKFNPLADWTWDDVWHYIRSNDLIYNPLHDRNYPSIGCSYCTRPVQQGEDLRSGRWFNTDKIECGLHQ